MFVCLFVFCAGSETDGVADVPGGQPKNRISPDCSETVSKSDTQLQTSGKHSWSQICVGHLCMASKHTCSSMPCTASVLGTHCMMSILHIER